MWRQPLSAVQYSAEGHHYNSSVPRASAVRPTQRVEPALTLSQSDSWALARLGSAVLIPQETNRIQ
jgi:hypothetical protein